MKVAAVQMTSGTDLRANVATAQRLIEEAALAGARLVLLPEYWPIMGMHEQDKNRLANSPDSQVMIDFLSHAAQQHHLYLIGGTVPMPTATPDKVYNSTLVFGPDGNQIARYDKIHLFGFTKGAESYQEANSIMPGQVPVSFNARVDDERCKVGLSICYDLRFPELYRGFGPTDLLVVPAAFTYTTGSVHWEILLRARAIENQCYVLASGQTGHHQNGRHTWGHSMLIDPWGKIVGELPDAEGVVCGKVDMNLIREVRHSLPALQHRTM
jgi:predicted amidohydrolase